MLLLLPFFMLHYLPLIIFIPITHQDQIVVKISRSDCESLLKKCPRDHTQNQNKTFNRKIWQSVPKYTYVGRQTFETCLYDAVAHFNIGNLATLRIFKFIGIRTFTRLSCSYLNNDSVENSDVFIRQLLN